MTEFETTRGVIKIARAESVAIIQPDDSRLIISRIDGEENMTFTTTPGENDTLQFFDELTHDIEHRDEENESELSRKKWMITREAIRLLLDDPEWGKEENEQPANE